MEYRYKYGTAGEFDNHSAHCSHCGNTAHRVVAYNGHCKGATVLLVTIADCEEQVVEIRPHKTGATEIHMDGKIELFHPDGTLWARLVVENGQGSLHLKDPTAQTKENPTG